VSPEEAYTAGVKAAQEATAPVYAGAAKRKEPVS
jgi:hypothetical protein